MESQTKGSSLVRVGVWVTGGCSAGAEDVGVAWGWSWEQRGGLQGGFTRKVLSE